MAFMMPVVKNDWDIYNSQRSRRVSESADKAPDSPKGSASAPPRDSDKFHTRLVEKLKRALGRDSRREERSS